MSIILHAFAYINIGHLKDKCLHAFAYVNIGHLKDK